MRTWLIHLFVATWLLTTATANVYVCMGPSSKKYHRTSDCRGLNNCSTKIYEVTLKYAQEELRRTQCGAGCYR
jgi:hypothetical protein